LAGAYFSHPHHQLLATPITPPDLKAHLQGAESYYKAKERCIYCDILGEERESGERIVYENDYFLAFCPYASRHPFEVWIFPKIHEANFFNARFQSYALAQTLRVVATRLSLALGELQFTSMIYTAPNAVGTRNLWRTLKDDFHWHIEVIPYFMKPAVVDRGADLSINPTFPEEAAKFLRELPVFL
jgi:UDPglucose--hexose-1-phosphate uridylyltransferase